MPVKPFVDETRTPVVRGFWHDAAVETAEPKGVLILAHGAGSNATAPVLVAVAEAFAAAGYGVLRCDLPFRQARPHGSPFPAGAAQDRAGLENAVLSVRRPGRVILGGHSYGGRQASMLLSEKPDLADALLLLSYPLHPPRKPDQLRTAHLPQLRTPALFVHGARDPFGSIEELSNALKLIPARTKLMEIPKAGHDLKSYAWATQVPGTLEELL